MLLARQARQLGGPQPVRLIPKDSAFYLGNPNLLNPKVNFRDSAITKQEAILY
jgi:hypothetical protein